MFQGEPDWSTKQLLDEIKLEAVRGGNNGNLTYLMPALNRSSCQIVERR
jgi:hypothetical protein